MTTPSADLRGLFEEALAEPPEARAAINGWISTPIAVSAGDSS